MYRNRVSAQRPMSKYLRGASIGLRFEGVDSMIDSELELLKTRGRAGRPWKYRNKYSPINKLKIVKETVILTLSARRLEFTYEL